jgi:branched-chain amino acid transport system permease protein
MTSDSVPTTVDVPPQTTADAVAALGWRDRLSVRLGMPLVGGLLVLAILALTVGPNAYLAGIVIETLFWVTAASAWNVLGGYTGMLSLGHALFIGVSMYAVTYAVNHGWSWWAATPVIVVALTVLGTLVLFPGFRLRGPFFSLATFALPLIATTLAVYAKGLTGGSQGETWPVNPSAGQFVFVGRVPYLLVIGVIALAAVLVSVFIDRRAIGRRMRAVADDDVAAAAAGVPATRTRLIATAISIALSSLAGCFYVTYVAFVDPTSAFALDVSLKVVLLAILGGLGRSYGPLIGAIILIPADSWLAGAFPGGVHLLLYGALLVVLVLFLPQGILGGVSQLAIRLRRRRA